MIINTIDELQEYVNTTEGFSIENLKPHHRATVKKHILPYLDRKTYDQLYGYILTGAIPAEWGQIAPFIKAAWANFAMLNALPQLIGRMSDNGFMRVEGDNERPAFKYEIKDLRQSYIENGYSAIEELLEEMEAIIAGDTGKFEDWQESKQCTLSREFFVASLADIEDYIDLGASRRKFMAIRPYMRTVEELTIRPALGDTLYLSLKDKMRSKDTSAIQKKLIAAIVPVVAHTAYAKALAFNVFQFTPEGLLILTSDEEQGYNSAEKVPSEQLSNAIAEHQKQARTFMAELRKFLNNNSTDLTGYTPPAPPEPLNTPQGKTLWL